LWFVLAALLPVLAAAFATRAVLSQNYRDDFERQAQGAQKAAEANVMSLGEELSEKMAAMSDPNDPFVGSLLQELAKSGSLSSQVLRSARQRGAPAAMKLARLQVFGVVDANGTVIVTPHYRPARDEQDASRRPLADRGGRAFFAFEQVFTKGTIERILVVESVRVAQLGSEQLTVWGGTRIDESYLASVRRPGTVAVRLIDPQGVVLVPAKQEWDVVASRTFRVPLRGADGLPVAYVEGGISERNLEEVLSTITFLTLVLGAAALVLTVLLGTFVARRITEHLDDLVVGAQAAAKGDLDHQVPVRTGDEIGEVAQALNLMMSDLKESKERLVMAERVAAWQEIARRLAHEIKNPLTPIQMAIETLRRTHAKKHESFEEIFEESTSTVLEEAARLKRIVKEFSEFARMPSPDKRPADLNELVAGTLSLYQGTVHIEKRLTDVPKVELDRDSMSQVILNLLENARDAIADNPDDKAGKILVRTHVAPDQKSICLAVEDNGPGIGKDVRDKLFTPYFTTKHMTGGSGLGLAIVHRIVSDHGGRIAAKESTLGGACFVIELPTTGTDPEDLPASMSGRWAS